MIHLNIKTGCGVQTIQVNFGLGCSDYIPSGKSSVVISVLAFVHIPETVYIVRATGPRNRCSGIANYTCNIDMEPLR